MPVTPAQAACNANALRKFGGLVKLDGIDVLGDFTAALSEREVGGMMVSASEPSCIVLDSSVPADVVGKSLVVGGVTYAVRKAKADDMGFTVLTLQVGR